MRAPVKGDVTSIPYTLALGASGLRDGAIRAHAISVVPHHTAAINGECDLWG